MGSDAVRIYDGSDNRLATNVGSTTLRPLVTIAYECFMAEAEAVGSWLFHRIIVKIPSRDNLFR